MIREPAENRFAAPGGEICWFEWGAPGDGPTLLMLHATGFHARCWDRTIAALPEGWHIVAPDLRGHGRSYRPDTISDWDKAADDAIAFAKAHLPRPAIAIGHSMGGTVATRAAALYPAAFAGLILVDPVIMPPEVYRGPPDPLGSDPNAHPVARRRNSWDSAEQMFERFADRKPYSLWQRDVLADYCRYGLVPAPGGGLELGCPPYLEASAYIGSTRIDPYPLLGDIKCPVTVIRARNARREGPLDFSISPTWTALAGAFAHGEDVDWGDLTHFIPMEAPERLAALIVERAGAGG